jgi:hypothetical protein
VSDDNLSTWMPTTSATVTFGVGRLISEGSPDAALGIIIVEILRGKFGNVVSALAALAPIDEAGIRQLLSERTMGSYATRTVYELAGLPHRHYPLFATCIDLTQEVIRVRRAAPSPQTSLFTLEKALATPAVQELGLSASFINHIRFHAGGAEAAPPPEGSDSPSSQEASAT